MLIASELIDDVNDIGGCFIGEITENTIRLLKVSDTSELEENDIIKCVFIDKTRRSVNCVFRLISTTPTCYGKWIIGEIIVIDAPAIKG